MGYLGVDPTEKWILILNLNINLKKGAWPIGLALAAHGMLNSRHGISTCNGSYHCNIVWSNTTHQGRAPAADGMLNNRTGTYKYAACLCASDSLTPHNLLNVMCDKNTQCWRGALTPHNLQTCCVT